MLTESEETIDCGMVWWWVRVLWQMDSLATSTTDIIIHTFTHLAHTRCMRIVPQSVRLSLPIAHAKGLIQNTLIAQQKLRE